MGCLVLIESPWLARKYDVRRRRAFYVNWTTRDVANREENNSPSRRLLGLTRLYAFEWGEEDLIGGTTVLSGQRTPPTWSSTRSR